MCMGILNLTIAEEVGKSSKANLLIKILYSTSYGIAAHSLTLSTTYIKSRVDNRDLLILAIG